LKAKVRPKLFRWLVTNMMVVLCLQGAFTLFVQAQHSASGTNGKSHHGSADKPSVHGMVLFGSSNLYASHLPLFRSPHDYQILLEIQADSASRALYHHHRTALRKSSEASLLYAIEPEVFVLPDMIAKPRPFKATLYHGHFERGGKAIAQVTLTITKVLYFKQFEPQAKRSPQTQYLVFGKTNEFYAAHIITAKPDFDHICSVHLQQVPNQHSLATPMLCAINTTNTTSKATTNKPLQKPQTLRDSAQAVTLRLGTTLYLEYDDLR